MHGFTLSLNLQGRKSRRALRNRRLQPPWFLFPVLRVMVSQGWGLLCRLSGLHGDDGRYSMLED